MSSLFPETESIWQSLYCKQIGENNSGSVWEKKWVSTLLYPFDLFQCQIIFDFYKETFNKNIGKFFDPNY